LEALIPKNRATFLSREAKMKVPSAGGQDKQKFYDVVVSELQKVPFGTFTKKDLECLLLHAFLESSIIGTRKSRDLANLLEINETRLKSLLLDIRYKFQPDATAQNVERLIHDLLVAQTKKLVHENSQFLFVIEDPVVKVDFEQAMKEVGYYADSSFNKELVKVRDYALVAFLFRRNNNDGTFAGLQKMRKAAASDEKDLLSKIQLNKSWLEIGKDLLSLTKEGTEKIELLVKIAKFLTTGSFG